MAATIRSPKPAACVWDTFGHKLASLLHNPGTSYQEALPSKSTTWFALAAAWSGRSLSPKLISKQL
jgi:hypothetical protein